MNPVTERSTKKEILEAYKASQQQTQTREARIQQPTSQPSIETTKRPDTFAQALRIVNELSQSITSFVSKFIEQANELKKHFLEEEETLERQMQQKRSVWSREQEEYAYQLSIQRKKEGDEYALKMQERKRQFEEEMTQRERVLKEREELLKAQEDEIKTLRKQAEAFPQELTKAVNEAMAKTKAEFEHKANIEAELAQKDMQREREIAKLTIQGLEETIKRQTTQIANLERQLSQALQRVQELAVSVIESSGAGSKKTGADYEPRAGKEK